MVRERAALPLLTAHVSAQVLVLGDWHSPTAATAAAETDSNGLHLHGKFPDPSVQEICSFHEWQLNLDLRKVHL